MGRLIDRSPRMRLHDTMRSLDRKYKMALKEEVNKAAFDALFKEWSNEDAAAVYQFGDTGVYSPMDLLNLNSTILNRREIQRLREDYEKLLETAKSLSGN
jgi:hypothetical protein